MSVTLNAVKVPGFNQKISVTLSLASEDMSGNSSATPDAETGDKAKSFSLSTSIRFIDAADLLVLITLAEAKNDIDERMVYSIVNRTARAVNVRQVRFNGDVTVREADGVNQWNISFKLVEYRSVSEKKEERVEKKKIAEQAAAGDDVSGAAAAPVEVEPEVELTATEEFFKWIDDGLA